MMGQYIDNEVKLETTRKSHGYKIALEKRIVYLLKYMGKYLHNQKMSAPRFPSATSSTWNPWFSELNMDIFSV